MRKIPKYDYLRAEELPPYQLFKRWKKIVAIVPLECTRKDLSRIFGAISREKMLKDIKENGKQREEAGND